MVGVFSWKFSGFTGDQPDARAKEEKRNETDRSRQLLRLDNIVRSRAFILELALRDIKLGDEQSLRGEFRKEAQDVTGENGICKAHLNRNRGVLIVACQFKPETQQRLSCTFNGRLW
jgi:hypothetical protein